MNSRLVWLSLLVTLAGVSALAETGELQIRLNSPVSSYLRSGTKFTARVVGPALTGNAVLPAGSVLRGTIRKVKSVGLGLRHERALLELAFDSCASPEGNEIPCEVELVGVDNARESVGEGNQIRGILAASHVHSWFNGVWYRPERVFVPRAAAGLTGTAGALQSRLAPTPVGAGIFFASRLLLMRMPEPEIEFPAGTDLLVRVKSSASAVDISEADIQDRIDPKLVEQPARVKRADGAPVQDLIHLAFAAPEEAIATAFAAAGWQPADKRTAGSVARTYGAYVSMKTYPTAPVSELTYEGRPPDLVFQKSLNSVSKRHHIRLWKDLTSDTPMYFAAATHDVGLGMRWTKMAMTHHIDPEIDRERTKVINDLADAGCVAMLEGVSRPDLIATENDKTGVVTDGRLFRVELQPCAERDDSSTISPSGRRNVAARFTRRLVLEGRHYFTRGNVFYWGIRGIQSGIRRLSPGPEQVSAIRRDKSQL